MNEITLRDIHLPEAVSWWPPAPGWWLLLMALVALMLGSFFLWRWMKHKPLRKLSVIEYKNIVNNFHQQQDSRLLLSQLSTLLRRILMSYQGRNNNASIIGDDWIKQLNLLANKNCFSAEQENLLSRGQFQRDLDFDSLALLASCEHWIATLPRSHQHVSV
ncbi:MAG: DUF4381 domain-containing protein [Gammaproteobacteria bacterium]|nr:DUF4381 domain-containing protein [Gammaproteobacteria bacterium]